MIKKIRREDNRISNDIHGFDNFDMTPEIYAHASYNVISFTARNIMRYDRKILTEDLKNKLK